MKKKLILLLLSGILGIMPAGSVFAEELSSGDEAAVVLDETVDPESGVEVFTEEVTSPQEETPTNDKLPEIEETASEDILTAGEAEGDLLESGEEIPAVGAAYNGTWGTCKWDINSNGVLTIHAGTGTNSETVSSPWNPYKDSIYSIVVEEGVVFPPYSKYLFSGLDKCTSMDLSKADTSDVIGMEAMFCGCWELASLDLSNFDTSNAITMFAMFSECYKLSSLNLDSFNTSNVMDMGAMFNCCSSLTALNLGSFDTSRVTRMSYMFTSCGSLSDLNLSSFDTCNVASMGKMFECCNSLTSLDLSNFDTSNVTNMEEMFYCCRSLTSLNLSSFDTSNVTDMGRMFRGCWFLSSLDLSHFDTSNVTNMKDMFYECNSLHSLDLSHFDTSNLTDTSGMFLYCNSLSDLNLSSFDTSNVTNMEEMFYACFSLTNIDLSNFDTSNVTTMRGMFRDCTALTSLDLSSFDTSNVTYMGGMFRNCMSLTSLDVSNFDTSNVTTMFDMFYACISLTSIDLNNFDTSNVTNMEEMFECCRSLVSIDVGNFNTSNVTYMSDMFSRCSSLTSLDVSNFNTSNVTNMRGMFAGCRSLIRLDLTSFDTSNVTDMSWMFGNCSALSEIKIGPGFSFINNGSYEEPAENLRNYKLWRSAATDKVYSFEEITKTRNNIADTYYAADLSEPKLIAAYNGAKGIGLKFHKEKNATEYKLYRKFDGAWSFLCTFSANDPNLQIDGDKIMYTDTSVARNYGKGYIYSVSAISGDFETTYNTDGAAIYRLTPPALTKITNSSAGTAAVSWKGVFGKTETNGTYDLQIAEFKDGKTGTFKSVTTLPGYDNQTLKATVTGLQKGCQYVFRIRCAKTDTDRGTYYSEYSKWLSVTITK